MRLVASLFILGLLAAGQAGAQPTSPAGERRAMEALPPHLQVLVDRQRKAALPGEAGTNPELQGLYNKLRLWDPGQPLRVCFFDGTRDLRTRIANAARQWEKDTRVRFDFGSPTNPRLCDSSQPSHIRVGFAYKGYWSLVGQQSVDEARQFEQSLNLEGFDAAPPAEPEFTQLVMHEFGHALGLEHEHQSPFSECEKEFDWPRVEAYLAGSPNFWSPEKTRHNMRRIFDDGNIRGSAFDAKSIMLYSFPALFYIKGTASTCFSKVNYEISKVDRETLNAMYPADGAAAAKTKSDAGDRIREKLSALPLSQEEKQQALKNIEVLSAPLASAPQRRETLEKLNAPLLK
jgi:hypothetical protein